MLPARHIESEEGRQEFEQWKREQTKITQQLDSQKLQAFL